MEEFCEILSDVHCPVYLELKFMKTEIAKNQKIYSEEKVKLWDRNYSYNFVKNFDVNSLRNLNEHIMQMRAKNETNQVELNSVVDNFSQLIFSAAKKKALAKFKHLHNNPIACGMPSGLVVSVPKRENNFIEPGTNTK